MGDLDRKGWAHIYKYLENEQFIYIHFIVQQNQEVIYYHWLVNKRTGNSVSQELLPDNPLYEMLEEAKILTAGNELVLLANAPILMKCTDPFFNSVNNIRNSLSEEANPFIVSLRIKDFKIDCFASSLYVIVSLFHVIANTVKQSGIRSVHLDCFTSTQ